MSQSINNRERFFRYVEEGLQRYFDECDRKFCGILHFTVGVREGKVGGIIKSDDTLSYEPMKKKRTSKNKTRNTEKPLKQNNNENISETILDDLG